MDVWKTFDFVSIERFESDFHDEKSCEEHVESSSFFIYLFSSYALMNLQEFTYYNIVQSFYIYQMF